MKNIYLLLCFLILATFSTTHAQTWNAMSSGLGPTGSSGTTNAAMAADGNNIYAAGTFTTAGGVAVHNVAKWDGNAWSDLNGGLGPYVYALAMYRGSLIAGGYFTTYHSVAAWDGSAWHSVGGGVSDIAGGNVNALLVVDTLLYVAGQFDTAGGVLAKSIAVYNGTNWASIGDVTGPNAHVQAMTNYNGKLVITGFFDHVGGVAARNIAMWDGTTWAALGTGINSQAYTVTADGANLYAGGIFDSAGTVASRYLAKWNGTAWSSMGNPNNSVFALTAGNGKLYVGGGMDSIGGQLVNGIAQWDGTSWSALGNGAGGTGYHFVRSLLIHNNDVYMGGTFFEPNSPGNAIARWGIATGVDDEVTENNMVSIYPNPGKGMINISLKQPTEKAVLEVFNLQGEKIYHTNINADKATVDISNTTAGIYFYRITTASGKLIAAGKYELQ